MEITDPNSEGISASNSAPVKHFEEDSQKVDSGMDEGSNSSQDIGANSEDEEVVSHRPKKTVHRIFDDESEDSRDTPSVQESLRSKKKELKTADEALEEILNASSSSDDDDSDGENVTLAASLKKKKIVKRQVSDESSDDDQETLSSVIKNPKNTMSDIFDAEEDSDNQGASESVSQKDSQTPSTSQTLGEQADDEGASNVPENRNEGEKPKKKKKKKKKKKEPSPQKKAKDSGFGTGGDFKSKEFISDSSDSDDDKEKPVKPKLPDDSFSSGDSGSSSSGSDSDGSNKSHRSNGDEGFDESAISPALLKKLKKGAAKKERPERRSKTAAKEEMMSIHSESQRMVRESRVSVPYHQPAPRSINDFLARATKKQQEYKVLKGTRDFTKAKLMQDLLQKTKLPAPTLSEPTYDSDEDWAPEDDGMKKLKDRLDEKMKGAEKDKEVNECAEENTESGIEKTLDIGKKDGNRIDEGGDSDNDSLPDIVDSDRPKVDDRLKPVQEDTASVTNSANIDDKTSDNMDTDENADQTENDAQSKRTETDKSMEVDESASVSQNDTVNDESKEAQTLKEGEHTVQSIENTERNGDSNVVSDTSSIDNLSQCNKASQNIETSTVIENDENKDPDMSLSQMRANNQKSPKEKGTLDIKVTSEKKKNKLAVLASLELDNVKPCLSGNSDAFVCLVEEETVPVNPGVAKLMDRLCKHSTKKEKKHATDVDISIIQKDKAELDKEELKLNTFTYHAEEEKENPLMKLETPGAKLTALKEQLQAKMKEKREQARQHRQEVYDLDNEEGGFNAEEEEAEMSDRSDTDVEDEDAEDENEEVLGEGEEEEGGDEEEREANPFADDEAEEDGDDDGGNMVSDNEEDEMNLKLDTSDESETEDHESSVKPVSSSKKERSFVISDNEETGDTDHVTDDENDRRPSTPAFKEPAEKSLDKPFSLFGSKSTSKESIPDTQFQSGQRTFGLTFPEESQDLYGNSTMPELGPTQYGQTQESQKLNFFLEDSQSNMLDADGYLRVKSTAKKPASRPTGLDDVSESQDEMGDLLGLCSGRFTGIQEPKDKTSRKSLFDEPEVLETQGNMDELMGLCSGVFSKASEEEGSQKKGLKRKVSEEEDDDIEAYSDNENQLDDKDDFIDDDDQEEDHDTDEVSEGEDDDKVDDDDDEERPTKFTGFTTKNKHGKIRSEFVEAEAELSGSEAESDEDLDLMEEEDIMEIEEGDKDKIADNEQLRDEVGRVHMKQLIDEDKRELMRFQEMYLPDGDLHTEGAGRIRRFRWNNNDDNTQQDMFDNDSEGEQVEEETDTDYKWRKERFEREQFIQEQQEKEQEDMESSQFMKFGKIFLKKQSSVDKTVLPEKPPTNKPTAPPSGKESPSAGFYKLSNQKRGSFLARSKQALAKIAEMTKPVANPSAGAKSSGKFTFSVISPDKENSQQSEKAEKPKRQARTDTSKNKVTIGTKPPAKKQKLDSEDSFTGNSIFNHL